MIKLPDKGIFYYNQVRAAGHFYDNKPRKLEGKQRLMTTYSRKSLMFISDGLAYQPVRRPTDEEMDSYTKVTINTDGECNPYDIDDDG